MHLLWSPPGASMCWKRHYSSLFWTESYCVVYVDNCLFFIRQSGDAHLGCSYVLASISHGAENIGCVCLFKSWILSAVRFMSEMTRSRGSSIFSVLRGHPCCAPSWLWAISLPGLPHCRQTLYHLSHQGSPKQGRRVPFSPGPLLHLGHLGFLRMAILTGVRWILVVVLVLICNSWIISNVEYLFMYFPKKTE